MIVWDFPDHKDRKIDANRLITIIKDFKERTRTMLDVTTAQTGGYRRKLQILLYVWYCRKLQIWSHLLKKYEMENFIFCAVNCLVIKIFHCNDLTSFPDINTSKQK